MRAILASLVAVATLAGCTGAGAPGASNATALNAFPFVEVHPAWHLGGAFSFQGNNGTAPDDVWWATDGSSYFYASGPRSSHLGHDLDKCPASGIAPNATVVLVSETTCSWEPFPTVACIAAGDVCAMALGHATSSPPLVTPSSPAGPPGASPTS